MPQILDVSMPQDLDLTGGWALRVTAVDATGALVAGVKVSALSIVADAPLGAVEELAVGPYMLVPGPDA
jgi:hypothetical protein